MIPAPQICVQPPTRLIFASVASALDERMAYASYQAGGEPPFGFFELMRIKQKLFGMIWSSSNVEIWNTAQFKAGWKNVFKPAYFRFSVGSLEAPRTAMDSCLRKCSMKPLTSRSHFLMSGCPTSCCWELHDALLRKKERMQCFRWTLQMEATQPWKRKGKQEETTLFLSKFKNSGSAPRQEPQRRGTMRHEILSIPTLKKNVLQFSSGWIP